MNYRRTRHELRWPRRSSFGHDFGPVHRSHDESGCTFSSLLYPPSHSPSPYPFHLLCFLLQQLTPARPSTEQFLAEWQTPIPLDVVFDSPLLNWSYSSFTSSQHPILGQPSLVEKAADLDSEFSLLSLSRESIGWARLMRCGVIQSSISIAFPWILRLDLRLGIRRGIGL